jgi:mono/diheme cytochrome c family protein
MVAMPDDVDKLIKLLSNKNGWVRDRAQEKLVFGKYRKAIPILRSKLHDKGSGVIPKIHIMWTLEGLDGLRFSDIKPLLKSSDRHVKKQVLTVLKHIINGTNYGEVASNIKSIISEQDSMMAPNIAYTVNSIRNYSSKIANSLDNKLISLYPQNIYVIDAVIGGLEGEMNKYLKEYSDKNSLIHKRLSIILHNKELALKRKEKAKQVKKIYAEGYQIYNKICSNCHGLDGRGISAVAPPLNRSEWVTGNKDKLISVILKGLRGPVVVNGKIYAKPVISGNMPSFGRRFSDEKIISVINFIRHNWNNNASDIKKDDVEQMRKRFKNHEGAFTAKELDKLFGGVNESHGKKSSYRNR